MKILNISNVFYPSIGGIETFSDVISKEFKTKGNDVILLTYTKNLKNEELNRDYTVLRNPSFIELLKLFKWADVILNNGLLVKHFIFYILYFKKIFVVHHIHFLENINGSIKRFFSSFFVNISVSKHINSKLLQRKNFVIYNPVSNTFFKNQSRIITDDRPKDLIYVGRIIEDKGVFELVTVFSELINEGYDFNLTIVGEGIDKKRIESFIVRNKLTSKVDFTGEVNHDEVKTQLQKHKIMIIPSKCNEAFGIVALEAMASGVIVLVNNVGGLIEAVGDSKYVFSDWTDLKNMIINLINNDDLSIRQKHQFKHINNFSATNIADEYLDIFKNNIN